MPTGRRDGTISNINEPLNNLPPPTFNFANLTIAYAGKGLNVNDLILLSGESLSLSLSPLLLFLLHLLLGSSSSWISFLGLHPSCLSFLGLFLGSSPSWLSFLGLHLLGSPSSGPSPALYVISNFLKLHISCFSGAHTIGVSHCTSFTNRLYNFTGKGDQDPALDPNYAFRLKRKCVSLADNITIVEMDPGSFKTFDLSYFKILLKSRGLFQSDNALITNAAARSFIVSLVNSPPQVFFQQFAASMEKMGRIAVKTGSVGEIRRTCAFVN